MDGITVISDSDDLRTLVQSLVPGLAVRDVAKASGQRVVYYCQFEKREGSPENIPDSAVVLKVAKSLNANAIAYLQREIDILNLVNSPYFPELYYNDIFSEDPRTEEPFEQKLFITVEELIPSTALTQTLQAYRSQCAVLMLLRELCNALSILWSQTPSIIHRDLKPDNILIKDDGSVVVIDLGITREEGAAGNTITGMIGPCTPGYCSPEQISGDRRNISYKADFFCLGIIAYLCLSGVNPFTKDIEHDLFSILDRVSRFQPPEIGSLCDIDARVNDLIMKLLKKHPHERPRTPKILLDTINGLIRELCSD